MCVFAVVRGMLLGGWGMLVLVGVVTKRINQKGPKRWY